MTPKTLATKLVALRVLTDLIKAEDGITREQFKAASDLGDRVTAAVEVDGQRIPVGSVTVTKPRAGSVTASVVDEQALLAWCRTHRPGAVTECVRTSDQRQILDEVKTYGGIMDPLTGTITEVPGIIVTEPGPGEPGCLVKPNADAERLIRQALADGTLTLADLAPLPQIGDAA